MSNERTELEQKHQARDLIDRGSRTEIAREVIEEICADLEDRTDAVFRMSDLHDAEGHQMCRLVLYVIDDIRQAMTARIEKGVAAHSELRSLTKLN